MTIIFLKKREKSKNPKATKPQLTKNVQKAQLLLSSIVL